MSSEEHDKEQEFLFELISGYSEELNTLIEDLTFDFQAAFGEDKTPLFLHIQLLSQHLGKAIASGPLSMREELISEAREQEQLVIDAWDNEDSEDTLADMTPRGNA